MLGTKSFPVFAEGLCSQAWACHPHFNTYWVGPKVHLHFSLRCDRKIWTNFLANLIVSNSSLYFLLAKTLSSAQGESSGPSQVFLEYSQSPGDAHTPMPVFSLPDFQKSELSVWVKVALSLATLVLVFNNWNWGEPGIFLQCKCQEISLIFTHSESHW